MTGTSAYNANSADTDQKHNGLRRSCSDTPRGNNLDFVWHCRTLCAAFLFFFFFRVCLVFCLNDMLSGSCLASIVVYFWEGRWNCMLCFFFGLWHVYGLSCSLMFCFHYENTPMQIYRKFHLQILNISRWKTLIFFHISAQNIDCGYSLEPPRRGGSNEYPQSMFLSKNKKNNVYPCKPQFTI